MYMAKCQVPVAFLMTVRLDTLSLMVCARRVLSQLQQGNGGTSTRRPKLAIPCTVLHTGLQARGELCVHPSIYKILRLEMNLHVPDRWLVHQCSSEIDDTCKCT